MGLKVVKVVWGALAVALTLVACQSPTDKSLPLASHARGKSREIETVGHPPRSAHPEPIIVLMAGETAFDADLYALRLRPPRLYRLTRKARISSVEGSRSRIVVADGRDPLFYDHLELYKSGRLKPVPGMRKQHAHTPDISNDGRLAYVTAKRNSNGDRLKVRRLGEDVDRHILSTRSSLQFPSWDRITR